jgi:1-acyl-sn-glycerol-3-phosphate acyltransferase
MRLTQAVCRILLRTLNINCRVVDLQPRNYTGHDGLLIVANHMSYLDVVLIAAHVPAVFITSREVETTPILGGVCRGAGCVFVERRRMTSVHRDLDQLTAVLNQNANVMLFPEGSTSDGSRFLRFKSTLVEAAVRSRVKIAPICIRYTAVDGVPFGDANRDDVAWYGDMTFFPHLMRVLATRRIDCELAILPAPAFRHHRSRKQLTNEVKRQLAAVYARTP